MLLFAAQVRMHLSASEFGRRIAKIAPTWSGFRPARWLNTVHPSGIIPWYSGVDTFKVMGDADLAGT
jgi:hypothetical protein